MSNVVFLIDANKTPMNPIEPAQAKKLLNAGKAAVFRRYPFVLIMKRVVENIVTYPITLKSEKLRYFKTWTLGVENLLSIESNP